MGASASGQRTLAIESARKLAAAVPAEGLQAAPILQGFLAVPYLAMVRFSEWDQILGHSAPAHDTAFLKSMWKYARAMPLLGKDRVDEAERELGEIKTLMRRSGVKDDTFSAQRHGILRIAPE